MYLNQRSPEPEPTEAQRLHQLMGELAAELADRTGKPWGHAPGVGQGLCIDCGGYRIIFEGTTLLRDRGRHNLKVEMFNPLSLLGRYDEMKAEAWAPWPQVKLTKSAKAIANQLLKEVIPRAIERRASLDEAADRRRREIMAANDAVEFITRDIQWLRIEPASGEFGQAQALGGTGINPEMGFIANSKHRQNATVDLHLMNIPLGTAKKIAQLIDLEATAQLIDQDEDTD